MYGLHPCLHGQFGACLGSALSLQCHESSHFACVLLFSRDLPDIVPKQRRTKPVASFEDSFSLSSCLYEDLREIYRRRYCLVVGGGVMILSLILPEKFCLEAAAAVWDSHLVTPQLVAFLSALSVLVNKCYSLIFR